MKQIQLDKRLSDYCSNKALRKRWGIMIKERALRFYLDNELDSYVASEDLLDCDFEDCPCLRDKHEKDCKFYGKKPNYCNLSYSEKHERKFKY